MKLTITGAEHVVNRDYEACGNYQWARELLQNALEAQAKRIEFGIEWNAVEKLGVYRRQVIDDGLGMSEQELVSFFSVLGAGSKKIGGIHDNFGIGAKVSLLPWNPSGLVVISKKNGKCSMIQIQLVADMGDYELKEFDVEGEKTCVVDPTQISWDQDEVDWSKVMPSWVTNNGTAVILLGSNENRDTVRGDSGKDEDKAVGLSKFLNLRFWDLTDVEVRVFELGKDRNEWPKSPIDEKTDKHLRTRLVKGSRHFLENIKSDGGYLSDSGSTSLCEGKLRIRHYLWVGRRPGLTNHAQESGYIAIKYKNELFEVSCKKPLFRTFGIIYGDVQQKLTLIIEPQLLNRPENSWGVFPDSSRTRLNFTGNSVHGSSLPLDEWGAEYCNNHPESIKEAIKAARLEDGSSIEDDEYRKRLQEKFGSRWKMTTFMEASKPTIINGILTAADHNVGVPDILRGRVEDKLKHKNPQLGFFPKNEVEPKTEGSVFSKQKEIPSDIPCFSWGRSEDFEKPFHLASWLPNTPKGPTVLLNRDATLFEEAINHFQQQFPPHFAEEVAKIVLQVYGEVAVSKLAHSQKLKKMISKEELDSQYRTEPALTISLMGLMAEENVIAMRLRALGKRPNQVQREIG